ncbi:MAG TPA: MFS transporter, partial [Mycobacterium sp.]|nr:MFS transporter [Mycobacterium sp.]
MLGFAAGVVWSFAVLPLIDTRDPLLFALAMVGTYAIIGVSSAPLVSFIPETFATRYRYTGAAVSFSVGGIVGGAVPPMLATALLASLGSWAVGAMMALFGLVSLVCVGLLSETREKTMTERVRLGPRLAYHAA